MDEEARLSVCVSEVMGEIGVTDEIIQGNTENDI